MVRLSRGTWDELAALRSTEAIGEDVVFPMSAVNAWKRVKRAARQARSASKRNAPSTSSSQLKKADGFLELDSDHMREGITNAVHATEKDARSGLIGST